MGGQGQQTLTVRTPYAVSSTIYFHPSHKMSLASCDDSGAAHPTSIEVAAI